MFASGREAMEGPHETTKDFFIFIDKSLINRKMECYIVLDQSCFNVEINETGLKVLGGS